MRDAGLTREVRAAYAHCARVVRRSESSFAAAFWLFPKPRRRALHAVYAFCRLADDIADDPGVRGDRRLLLGRWRAELTDAYLGKAQHPVGIALGDAVHRFRLSQDVFLDLLRGVESDLLGESMETFEDLRRYCYRVASTVGLLVVQVLEARSPRSFEYAETLGIAVQLTSIKGPFARLPPKWRARAMSSLPVPCSPRTSTVVVLLCTTLSKVAITSRIAGDSPTIRSVPKLRLRS